MNKMVEKVRKVVEINSSELPKESIIKKYLKANTLLAEYLVGSLISKDEYLKIIAENRYANKRKENFKAVEIDWERLKDNGIPNIDSINKLNNLLTTQQCAKEIFLENYKKYRNELLKHIPESALSNLINNKTNDNLRISNKIILVNILKIPSILDWEKTSFIKWYVDKAKRSKCEYCQSSVENLLKFYCTHPTKRNRGLAWEIDRKDSSKTYSEQNCALVCHYCNNAKSDIFSESEFRGRGNKSKPSYIALAIGDAIRRETAKRNPMLDHLPAGRRARKT